MFSRCIENYLSRIADSAENILSLERNCLQDAINAWRKSPAWRRLAKAAPAIASAIRAASSGDLHREYGAARKLAGFVEQWESDIKDSLTKYTEKSPRKPAPERHP
jgi:hypothetical protein